MGLRVDLGRVPGVPQLQVQVRVFDFEFLDSDLPDNQQERLPMAIDHPENKHPEPYQHEMNPHANEGQNRRDAGPHPEKAEGRRSAFDVKDLHRQLQDYNDADLKQIPVLPAGHRLEAGATYINLRDPMPREYTGAAHMQVGSDDWIVPKAEVPYPLWNRLIGVTDPERLDRAISE